MRRSPLPEQFTSASRYDAHMSRRASVLLLLVCLAVALIPVVYPVYVIRPFRAQGARELAVALAVMRFRNVATVIPAVAALGPMVAHWPAQPSRQPRAGAAIGARGCW